MAKRLTDTAKWDKKWFRKLGPRLRDLRQFLLDRCDHSGIIELDFDAFKFYLGQDVTLQDVKTALNNNFEFCNGIENEIFIPDFVEFQYKISINDLDPDNRIHKSIINRLAKKRVCKPFADSLQRCKDKDKDKEKDKVNKARTGPKKQKGAVAEFSDFKEYLVSVSYDCQKKWIEAYPNLPWLKQEIKKSEMWVVAKGQKKKNLGLFITNWLNNANFPGPDKCKDQGWVI